MPQARAKRSEFPLPIGHDANSIALTGKEDFRGAMQTAVWGRAVSWAFLGASLFFLFRAVTPATAMPRETSDFEKRRAERRAKSGQGGKNDLEKKPPKDDSTASAEEEAPTEEGEEEE